MGEQETPAIVVDQLMEEGAAYQRSSVMVRSILSLPTVVAASCFLLTGSVSHCLRCVANPDPLTPLP